MKTMILAAAVSAATFAFSSAVEAAPLNAFGRTTNDGVFALTAGQAEFLGTPEADRIGFFRVRSGGAGNVSWEAGDTFTRQTFLNSITSGAANIQGVFNGLRDDLLDYGGDTWAPLDAVTFLASSSTNGNLFRAIAFTWNSSAGNIVAVGSSTFGVNALNTGDSGVPELAPIPLPAAAWLLLSGLAGMGLLARRRRAA